MVLLFLRGDERMVSASHRILGSQVPPRLLCISMDFSYHYQGIIRSQSSLNLWGYMHKIYITKGASVVQW